MCNEKQRPRYEKYFEFSDIIFSNISILQFKHICITFKCCKHEVCMLIVKNKNACPAQTQLHYARETYIYYSDYIIYGAISLRNLLS